MASFSITDDKDEDAVILGLGRLGMGSYPQTSPGTFTDVGYIKAASFAYNREFKEFESAGLLVKRLVFRDRLTLTAEYAEVSITNLNRVIQGTKTGDNIEFGGHRNIDRFAVRFEHQRSDNKIIQITMFKSVPAGQFQFAFAEEEFVRYPVEFSAEADPDKAAGKQYGVIKLIP